VLDRRPNCTERMHIYIIIAVRQNLDTPYRTHLYYINTEYDYNFMIISFINIRGGGGGGGSPPLPPPRDVRSVLYAFTVAKRPQPYYINNMI